jgi:hypothetical protein
MSTTTPSAALVPVVPVFTDTERLALAGFLAGRCRSGRPSAHLWMADEPRSFGEHDARGDVPVAGRGASTVRQKAAGRPR